MIRRAVRLAARIVVVSGETRRDLIAFDPRASGKSVVIPNGAEDGFFRAGEKARPDGAPPGPYLLFLGNDKPHKNLDGLLAAWARLRTAHPLLGFASRVSRRRAAGPTAPGLSASSRTPTCPRPRGRAERLVLPSFAEGFGLPVLEAQAAGTPVACSDLPRAPRGGGGAARLLRPVGPGVDRGGPGEPARRRGREVAAPRGRPSARRRLHLGPRGGEDCRALPRGARPMRVALVHDWLTGTRGGERVLRELSLLFPDAPLFTLFHFPGTVPADIERLEIRTTFLQRLVSPARDYRKLLPLFFPAAETWDLSGFDLVLSSSHCVAKNARKDPRALHVCYCHTPVRYLHDQFDDYFRGRSAAVRALAEPSAFRSRRGTARRPRGWTPSSRTRRTSRDGSGSSTGGSHGSSSLPPTRSSSRRIRRRRARASSSSPRSPPTSGSTTRSRREPPEAPPHDRGLRPRGGAPAPSRR